MFLLCGIHAERSMCVNKEGVAFWRKGVIWLHNESEEYRKHARAGSSWVHYSAPGMLQMGPLLTR